MARLVLHIGAHKTGTSFLQSLFTANRTVLQAHGIHYPQFGKLAGHHPLAAVWMPVKGLPDRFFGAGGPEALWQDLVDRHADLPGTVLISSENFSRVQPKAVDLPDLARRVARFEDVQIVYAIRNQAEMVQSIWLQLASDGIVVALRGLVERAIDEGIASGVTLDYGAMLDRLVQVFPQAQVTVLDYASFRRTPGGIAQVFLDLLGSRLRAEELKPVPPEQANISPDPLAMYVASQIAGGQTPPPDLVAQVGTLIRPQGPCPSTLLMRSQYARLGRAFARRNAVLVNRIRQTQPGFSFDPPVPLENLLYRDDLTVHHWAAIAAALYREGRDRSRPLSAIKGLLSP